MSIEFQEIGHSGGKITCRIRTNQDGGKSYQLGITHSRPVPTTIIQLYALPQGIPIESISAVGIGSPVPTPSYPGSYPVFLSSDSEGKFGHKCRTCEGYWRSDGWAEVCPYCGKFGDGIEFLSEAQLSFIEHYCKAVSEGLNDIPDGDVVIDMDRVVDEIKEGTTPPAFYGPEKSQQHKFNCVACQTFNDILGLFGYCSTCGTRNDLAIFRSESIDTIRVGLNSAGRPERALRDAVSAFDSMAAQYAKQLTARVPLTAARRDRLKKRFHKFEDVRSTFLDVFDIDVAKGMSESERSFLALAFFRRHLHEHNGGEVDERYIRESGDKTMQVKQLVRESQAGVNRVLDLLVRVAGNLHQGFHELIPTKLESATA